MSFWTQMFKYLDICLQKDAKQQWENTLFDILVTMSSRKCCDTTTALGGDHQISRGGLGRSGDEKLFISRQSDAKIFFSHSRDAKIFLPTFCVTEDIHGAWVQIFFSPLLRRNLFISPFLRWNLFISKFFLARSPPQVAFPHMEGQEVVPTMYT